MSSPTLQTTHILLLGAGELGTAFLTHLRPLLNIHITIGIRTPSKYTHLVSPTTPPSNRNMSLTSIDLTAPSSTLSQTFSHFDVIISATGFAQSPASIVKLAEEVLEAGRIRQARLQSQMPSNPETKEKDSKIWFFPWQWGVDYDITGDGQGLMPLFGAQRDVRNLLRREADEAGVKWTVVSTGIFMSFLFEAFWGIVDHSNDSSATPSLKQSGAGKGDANGSVTVHALRDWEHKVTVTDVDDIARVLARIISGDVDAENKILYTAGETVSYADLADIVERVSGKNVIREVWDLDQLEEEVKRHPEDGIKKYRLVFAREGVWWDKKGTVNEELGMNLLGVEEYARELFGSSSRGV
ncbi:hypothetical protein FB567DRAFT_170246 [Paraphoma chrysanthemicola]|uniref:NmrA-like domain-containing protein n=1 Tax=Paraphoma chrysanthemicola TaxID=798071 RepID=A0A8K0RGZ1_9PLEO|nr:hypothetical protein FB567DRAFT_170246 [Paraphoma chrysanthemicola]